MTPLVLGKLGSLPPRKAQAISAIPDSNEGEVGLGPLDLGALQGFDTAKISGVGRSSVALRAEARAEIRGLRALRVATGLEGRVPLRHLRNLRRVRKLEGPLAKVSDRALRERFASLGKALRAGKGRMQVLPEAFAVASETCRRVLGKSLRDEQILVAIALIDGATAELGTGEGKTLAVGLAAALLGLEKKGVHVLTSNGYLARRDRTDLAPWLEALGLSAGVVDDATSTSYDDKREAYAADITYGDVNTVAFDWLEDQTWFQRDHRVMRGLHAALVDEADDVLRDIAQKPLVLSRPGGEQHSSDGNELLRRQAAAIVDRLRPDEDVCVYLEGEQPRPHLSEQGVIRVEDLMRETLGLPADTSVWETEYLPLLREIQLALEVSVTVRPGVDYVRLGDQVVLIDKATGRPNPGGRLRNGLHDALLAKEGLPAEAPPSIIGVGAYQHFFNAYGHLGGTTGSAQGIDEEFRELYGMPVVRIPTHRPVMRKDLPDRWFTHPAIASAAAVSDLLHRHELGQPVIVATESVQESKRAASLVREPLRALAAVTTSSDDLYRTAASCIDGGEALLDQIPEESSDADREVFTGMFVEHLQADPAGAARFVAWLGDQGLDLGPLLARPYGAPFRVLNAENHEEEAAILATAGKRGSIVIATQMAGRGGDIPVDDDVLAVGGLHIIALGRKMNPRQDVQLVGRTGRQGAVGSSQFFLSPSDAFLAFLPARTRRRLARRLSGDRPEVTGFFEKALLDLTVRRAQQSAELRAESIRRINTRLDGALEKQRDVMLAFRDRLLDDDDLVDLVSGWATMELLASFDGPSLDRSELCALVARFDPSGDSVPGQDRFSREEIERLLPRIIERKVDAHRQRSGTSESDFNQYVREMILYHLDEEWLELLVRHENLRDTALMRANLNAWAEHTEDVSVAFAEMCGRVHETVVDRLGYQLS